LGVLVQHCYTPHSIFIDLTLKKSVVKPAGYNFDKRIEDPIVVVLIGVPINSRDEKNCKLRRAQCSHFFK
jgi:hypothetical protein